MSARKRAVSLSSNLDAAVYGAAGRRFEKAFREYYSIPRPDEAALAKEFFAPSQEAWPD